MSRKLKIRCWQQRVGSTPTTGTRSEWTALHSKSPASRLGFSYAALSFVLFSTELFHANFRPPASQEGARGSFRHTNARIVRRSVCCGAFDAAEKAAGGNACIPSRFILPESPGSEPTGGRFRRGRAFGLHKHAVFFFGIVGFALAVRPLAADLEFRIAQGDELHVNFLAFPVRPADDVVVLLLNLVAAAEVRAGEGIGQIVSSLQICVIKPDQLLLIPVLLDRRQAFGGKVLLLTFRQNIPDALAQIVSGAFSPASAAAGGASGFFVSMQVGIARGIFTHEAGLGSASIAHACSGADSPVEQGFWGIFEVFCDTILVCSVTALAILTSGVPLGPSAAQAAFTLVMGQAGGRMLAVAVSLFAFASVISFCLYGQRCIEYLFPNSRLALPLYRLFFLTGCAAGCFAQLPLVFSLADLLNACLLLPNLAALLILSPQVFEATREYFAKGGTRSCSSAR